VKPRKIEYWKRVRSWGKARYVLRNSLELMVFFILISLIPDILEGYSFDLLAHFIGPLFASAVFSPFWFLTWASNEQKYLVAVSPQTQEEEAAEP